MGDPSQNIGCQECMDLLAEYVDGTLPREQSELLEWHIESCAPCVAFLNTYRGTMDAAKRLRQATLPPELRDKLIAFLQRSNVR
jgi:anti-sigma factor RsiW